MLIRRALVFSGVPGISAKAPHYRQRILNGGCGLACRPVHVKVARKMGQRFRFADGSEARRDLTPTSD